MFTRLKSWFSTSPTAPPPGEADEFARLNVLKAEGHAPRGTDFARAQIFLRRRQTQGAVEALKEELRYNPDHTEATALLAELLAQPVALPDDAEPEFRELFAQIRTFTMVGPKRLLSLYRLARETCERDLPGNFVECGVAAGGSSALLGAVIARHSKRPRTVFSCDTFEGMPAATAEDTTRGVGAEASGWGRGTCAAPVDSLREICTRLGVSEIVQPLVGLFADTLPVHRERMGEIAFLHLDGDWYSSTRDILINLYDQTAPGARMQIDDFGCWDGCRRAIEEFETERGIKFTLNKIDETGVWTTKP